MKSKKLHTTLLLTMLWSFSFAQQYTNYTTKDGLPSNHVYRITQDYQGFIWFITDKGMVKYNGSTFKTFTTKEGLPTNDIWDIRIGHDNKIWFFTKATKLGYIEDDIVYTFGSTQKNEVLYPRVISQHNNKILFSDGKKIFNLEKDQWTAQILGVHEYAEPINHQKITSLISTPKKDKIKVTDHNNKVVKTYKLSKSLNTYKYRGQINDSLFCWLSNESLHIFNFNTLEVKEVSYKFNARKFIRYSAVNNQIQFSGENFVSFLDVNYQLSNTIQIPKHLNSHFSFVDKNKNLWIATFTNGVYFLPASKRKSTYSLQNDKVSKIQNVNGDIIASVYNKGFFKFNYNQKKFLPFLNIDDFIFSANYIKELDTYYYVANDRVITKKNNIETIYKRDDIARSILFFNKYLYTNTSFGISKINPKDFSLEKEYFQNGIRDIVLFKDELFLATASGIKQFSNDTITSTQIGNNLFNKPITSLSKLNEKELIVGTNGFGAYITDLNRIDQLEQSEYLNIQSSFIDKDNIWLATNKGVWYYKKENETIELTRKYTTNNGLSLDQTNAVYVIDNKLIASNNDGISIIPLNQKESNQFINLYFDEVTYDTHQLTNNLVKYNANNHLQVKVACIDFSNNNEFVYQYQLLPIQKKWITTTSKQLSYTDLPPNKYVLNIRSKEKKDSVHFIITPLWYQTLWAKLVFSLVFITALTGVILLIRKRELKKQTKKLNTQKKLAEFELYALRSQMNPHFVFNSLNAIQYYLNDNKIELSEEYLVKFSKLIRMFFDFSEHKVISIKEEVQLLNAYLEIEKLRFGTEFNYLIDTDNNLNLEQEIPAMLLQPIVENAVNHGLFHNFGKGLIQILFKRIDDRIYEVIIEDNGVGRRKAKEIKEQSLNKHQSKSTQILQERIALLNQSNQWNVTYKITDLDKENNNGTRVYLKFKRL